MKPQRIQLSRKKGWRLPPGAVVVSRPSRWGNPWKVGGALLALTGPLKGETIQLDQAKAVEFFEKSGSGKSKAAQWMRAECRRLLVGKDLACWCKTGTPCHGDVLLRWANEPAPKAGIK